MKKRLLALLVTAIVQIMGGCSNQTPSEEVYEKETPAQEAPAPEASAEEKAEPAAEAATEAQEVQAAPELGDELLLSTTTSTRDSGLLDAILGDFTVKTGVEVKVIAVGTGKALQMGRDGEADVLLVHAKASEETFVEEGYGTKRYDVMYNDFVVVGPAEDPAGLKESAVADVVAGLKAIRDSESKFLSRGDDSGTHKKELSLWAAADLTPEDSEAYISTGKGMGDTLMMASEMQGYALTDRATYLNMKDNLDLAILLEGDALMFNQYGVIPVNPELNDLINHEEAMAFVEWLLSEETQEMIGAYGVDKFGSPLFTPNGSEFLQ